MNNFTVGRNWENWWGVVKQNINAQDDWEVQEYVMIAYRALYDMGLMAEEAIELNKKINVFHKNPGNYPKKQDSRRRKC